MSPYGAVSGVIPASQHSTWRDLVSRAKAPDIYLLPEYVGFFERNEAGEALLFFYQEDGPALTARGCWRR
jgi:hypothetical protein